MKLPKFTSYPYQYLLAGFAALCLLYALFVIIDVKGIKPKYAVTRVVARQYRPLSHSTIATKSGNTFHTRKVVNPAAWLVAVKLEEITAWGEVTHWDYEKMEEGTQVEVVYAPSPHARADHPDPPVDEAGGMKRSGWGLQSHAQD